MKPGPAQKASDNIKAMKITLVNQRSLKSPAKSVSLNKILGTPRRMALFSVGTLAMLVIAPAFAIAVVPSGANYSGGDWNSWQAQSRPFSQVSNSYGGRGSLNVDGRRSEPVSLRVNLEQNGNFRLFWDPGAGLNEVSGKWTWRGNNVALTVEKGPSGVTASGSGMMYYSGANLNSVSVRGDSSNGRYSFNFSPGRNGVFPIDSGGPNRPGQTLSFNSRSGGNGTFSRGRDRETIRDSRVIVNRNGTFEIQIIGAPSVHVSGHYRRLGNRLVGTIDHSGRDNAQGAATINLNGNRDSFNSYHYTASINGELVTVSFNRN